MREFVPLPSEQLFRGQSFSRIFTVGGHRDENFGGCRAELLTSTLEWDNKFAGTESVVSYSGWSAGPNGMAGSSCVAGTAW